MYTVDNRGYSRGRVLFNLEMSSVVLQLKKKKRKRKKKKKQASKSSLSFWLPPTFVRVTRHFSVIYASDDSYYVSIATQSCHSSSQILVVFITPVQSSQFHRSFSNLSWKKAHLQLSVFLV